MKRGSGMGVWPAKAALRASLTQPGTWLGFVATTMITLSTLTGRKLVGNFATFGPVRTLRSVIAVRDGDLLMLPAILMLIVAFLLLRPSVQKRPLAYRTIFLLWCLPLLPSAPVLSDDVFLYLDQGWQLQNGYAPYSVGLTAAGGPFANAVFGYWSGTAAIYPPLAIEFQRLAVVLGDSHVIPSVWAMRLIVVACCLVMSYAVPYLATKVRLDPVRALYLALLNPLTVIHFVGGGHNDALMVMFSCLAFVVAFQRRPWWLLGSALAGLAALSKQPGLWGAVVVAMIAFPTVSWLRRILAAAASVAVAVATFIVGSLLTGLGFGWTAGTDLPSWIPTVAPASVISRILLDMTRHDIWPLMKVACYVPTLLIMAWLMMRRWRFPFTAAAAGWIAYALFAPALHPWYLLGGLPFVGVLRLRPAWTGLLKIVSVYLLVGSWATEVVSFRPHVGALIALFFAMLSVWGWNALQRQLADARAASKATSRDDVGESAATE